MRWPCEYFFRYLRIDGNDLAEAAHVYGYPPPDTEYAAQLDTLIQEGRPDRVVPDTVETDRWLRAQRVFGFFEAPRHPALDDACKILADPCMRPTMEMLILSALPPPLVAQFFEAATGMPILAETVVQYEHFFWARRLLSGYQWREFLTVTRYPDHARLVTVLSTPPEVALWHLGFRLHLDRSKAISTLFDTNIIRSLEASTGPASQSNSVAVRNYSEVAFAAATYLDGSEDETTRHGLLQKQLRIRYTGTRPPPILEVSNGQHSNVLQLPVKTGD